MAKYYVDVWGYMPCEYSCVIYARDNADAIAIIERFNTDPTFNLPLMKPVLRSDYSFEWDALVPRTRICLTHPDDAVLYDKDVRSESVRVSRVPSPTMLSATFAALEEYRLSDLPDAFSALRKIWEVMIGADIPHETTEKTNG